VIVGTSARREVEVAGCGAGGQLPGKRSAHVAVVHGGYMWVWGGKALMGAADTGQGLTIVQFSAQPEPFLTQNSP
jgi:hypothetical protein